jgi:chromosome segregation ATPase
VSSKPEQPLPDEWVAAFDDMVRVQQRTERERDKLQAQLEITQEYGRTIYASAEKYQGQRDELRAELERLRAELHRVAESRRGQRERAERAEAENERLKNSLPPRLH